LATLLAHKALELRDCTILDEAEEWHKKVAESERESQEYLRTMWPYIKQDFIKRIELGENGISD